MGVLPAQELFVGDVCTAQGTLLVHVISYFSLLIKLHFQQIATHFQLNWLKTIACCSWTDETSSKSYSTAVRSAEFDQVFDAGPERSHLKK